MITLPLHFFVQGASPEEVKECPSLAFSIRHIPDDKHLLFDLGLRRDATTYPPVARDLIAKWMPIRVPQSVDESLSKGGIDPKDVETIIVSHVHWDQ